MCHQHHVESDEVKHFTTTKLKRIKKEHENKTKEGVFQINPDYVDQVLIDFEEVKKVVKETLESTQRVEGKTDAILKEITNLNASIYSAGGKVDADGTSKSPNWDYLVPTISQLVGRENELEILQAAIASHNTIEIGGISGVGKTALLAKTLSDFDMPTIWVDLKTVNEVASLIGLTASFFADRLNEYRLQQLQRSPKSNSQNLIQALISICEENSIILAFDGFTTQNKALAEVILLCNKFFKKARVIFTTTERNTVHGLMNPCCLLDISGLGQEGAIELLKVYGVAENELGVLEKLCLKVSGHPYMLQLIAGLSKTFSISDLLSELQDLTDDKLFEYVNTKWFQTLNPQEQTLLTNLSVLKIPFRVQAARFLGDSSDSLNMFSGLVSKYLISRLRIDNSLYYLHEVVRSFAFQRIEKKHIKSLNQNAYDYLSSIDNPKYFEGAEAVVHAIEAGSFSEAKAGAYKFLSTTMGTGMFQLALQFAGRLEKIEVAASWDIIYYAKGRVFRFSEDHEQALEEYRNGLSYSEKGSYISNVLKLEMASVVGVLAKRQNDKQLRKQAKEIFEEFADLEISIERSNALMGLGLMRFEDGEQEAGIEQIRIGLEEARQLEDKLNIVATGSQLLGDCYSTYGDHDKAIEWLLAAFEEYWQVKEAIGMNAFEGIYQAASSLAWAYSDTGKYQEATQHFAGCVHLASGFGMLSKLERSLFDFGYHSILVENFEDANQALTEHYQLITQNDIVVQSDLPLILGSLMVAHWYSGDYDNAIELAGLFVISCAQQDTSPFISIAESKHLTEEFDFQTLFLKKAYLLVVPDKHDFDEVHDWIEKVIARRPDLEGPLKSFQTYNDGDDFMAGMDEKSK